VKFTAYVLQSTRTGRLYTGSTSDFERRFAEHNANESFSTKNQGPWELVHREEFESNAEAVRRERELKTGKGRDFIRQILRKRERS
jgi:putative endonuclease